MIVRLILPKGATGQAQYPHSSFRRDAFEPLQDSRHRNFWSPHDVHVIGHDEKSMQIIKLSRDLPILQSFDHHLSHPGILQPEWAGTGAIKLAILKREAFPGSGRRQDRPPHVPHMLCIIDMICIIYMICMICIIDVLHMLRMVMSGQCPRQSPRCKDGRGIRYPMRQTPLRINHYDLRDPRRGFLSCDWRILIFFRFGLLMMNVPLP